MDMPKYRTMMALLFSIGILCQECNSDVTCKNDKDKEVDWYILYKFPGMENGGLSYLYMDESTNGWVLSRENINSESGTLANTLKPLLDFYKKKTEGFGYMLYSDQPPDLYVAPPSFGHSKGVVMLDRNTGVWLSHSTPKFPTYRNKRFWPTSGNANAQTFMCVTYSYNDFIEIGLQLKYIHAYSYDSELSTFPNELRCVAQRSCYPKREPWSRVKTLTSVGGQKFHSFAKYKRFGDDLYSGFIAKELGKDLYVKSWGKMRRSLPSNCSVPHHVYNVKEVQLPNMEPFTDTVDHSKWCVTPGGGWTCIADMNREVSQMDRGGGAMCIENSGIAQVFTDMTKRYDPCEPVPLHNQKVFNTGKSPAAGKSKKIGKKKPNKKPLAPFAPWLTLCCTKTEACGCCSFTPPNHISSYQSRNVNQQSFNPKPACLLLLFFFSFSKLYLLHVMFIFSMKINRLKGSHRFIRGHKPVTSCPGREGTSRQERQEQQRWHMWKNKTDS
ncbi:deoxyribonuclease-2-alpha-like [Trachinotus anak]|uniref:deoxyribonuclease-2-alpha-like n=1 Tax=Trachinotus anak TaxID=443729 RepID=UPI0039F1F9EB